MLLFVLGLLLLLLLFLLRGLLPGLWLKYARGSLRDFLVCTLAIMRCPSQFMYLALSNERLASSPSSLTCNRHTKETASCRATHPINNHTTTAV